MCAAIARGTYLASIEKKHQSDFDGILFAANACVVVNLSIEEAQK